MSAVKNHLSAFPISPRSRIDTDCPGGLFDRPAHRPALGQQVFGKSLWLRKEILTQKPYNGWYGLNRRHRMTLFPVQNGPENDSELIGNFLLGKLQNKAPTPDMLTQGRWFKILWLWN